jgi:hypothetical protein
MITVYAKHAKDWTVGAPNTKGKKEYSDPQESKNNEAKMKAAFTAVALFIKNNGLPLKEPMVIAANGDIEMASYMYQALCHLAKQPGFEHLNVLTDQETKGVFRKAGIELYGCSLTALREEKYEIPASIVDASVGEVKEIFKKTTKAERLDNNAVDRMNKQKEKLEKARRGVTEDDEVPPPEPPAP